LQTYSKIGMKTPNGLEDPYPFKIRVWELRKL